MQKYRSLFSHLSAAIQSRKYSLKGDTIQYIYTDSKHSNPICRATPIENLKSLSHMIRKSTKKRYRAAETIPGFFGFDRSTYSSNFKRNNGRSGGGMKS
ncbi:MAG TPA: hypothetical protein VE643_05350 [Nitrososphaeraceae archaeon]|nr:hypothetical protein [Nitrososphaeraceae archaeon]